MKRYLKEVSKYSKKITNHLWDLVVPHERNCHHPHVLKHRVLVGYSVMLVLLKVLAIVAPVALPSSSLYSSAITPQNIIDLTNQTRTNLNLSTLVASDKLTQAATAKAEDMVANQYFAHVSPTGLTPWSWMVKADYKYKYAGENLAVHFTSAEGVQEGWLASPSHRANIVNENYTEIGVGVAMGEFESYPTTFVVQMFGQPVSTAQPVVAVTVPPTKVAEAPKTPPVIAEEPVIAVPAETPVVVTEPSIIPEVVQQPVEPVIQPVAESIVEPVVELNKNAPTLDETSVIILQQDGYYDVRLNIDKAKAVSAYLGDNWNQLVQSTENSDIWSGSVAYNSAIINNNGEQLSVVATGDDNEVSRFVLAWVAPNVKTQNLYTFNEGSDKYARFFGFLTINNLQDSVRKFYFFFMIFLAAALIINILVKVRVQKLSVIGHTIFVLVLATLLLVI